MTPGFPFSAVIGQDRLKLALLLCAIDPAIGGLLVQGPRGVAKTTLARAFAELLPGSFVELPLGATEERVAGSLDLSLALGQGQVQFAPGLLARAHEGVLYVDEVNLLPDALVDLLLDAAASGRNVVERDGVSHVHAARFVLVGTMNPDEGELRPQLIDRFGLSVHAESLASPEQRTLVVLRRLEFEQDPAAFVARHAAEQQRLRERCQLARAALASVPFDGPGLARAAELCHAAGVEGVRADLAMLRAARAHAAWQGRGRIEIADVELVAELALGHRRRAGGGGAPGAGAGGAASPGSGSPAAGSGSPQPSGGAGLGAASGRGRSVADDATAGASRWPGDRDAAPTAASEARDRGSLAAVPVRAAAAPALPAWIFGGPARRSPPSSAARQRRARGQARASGSIDWVSTLLSPPRPPAHPVRRRARRLASDGSWVITLDRSASMLRSGALASAKGIAAQLVAQAPRRSSRVALISFGGREVRVEAISSAPRALGAHQQALASITASGTTPLRQALELALSLCASARMPTASARHRILLLTDGRTRESLAGLRLPLGCELVVIDCERGPLRLGRARGIAEALSGAYFRMPDAGFHAGFPAGA